MAEWNMSGAPDFKDVFDLVEAVQKGELALPEFQRDFVWRPTQVCELLMSIAQGWPTGSLLLLTGEQATIFQPKPVERAPELKEEQPETLVLDGQQRLTAIFHAFTDVSEDSYFCRLLSIRDDEEIGEDAISCMKRTRFLKEYPDLKAQAEAGVITVSCLARDEQFSQWINHLPEEEQAGMFDLRQKHLPGLRNYQMPAVVLSGAVPLAAVAKIFETINRTGMRLETFDLMVARLYPYEFKLRDKWEKALKESSTTLGELEGDGITCLKIVALWEHLAERAAGTTPYRVKGVNESHVLQLRPDVIIRDWEKAVGSYSRALAFMQEQCGVIRPNLIPAPSIVIPLADALRDGEASEKLLDQLKRWYWSTAVHQTYAQAANTQAVSDAQALRAWAEDDKALPEVVKLGMPQDEMFAEMLKDARRRNEMLVRGLMGLVVVNDAKDWSTNKRLRDEKAKLDIHHVFPKDYLMKRGSGDGNVVINFAPLLSSTNRSLGSDHPSQVVLREDIKQKTVERHYIDWATYSDDDWEGFVEARVASVTAAFAELLA